jgi:hypothetical protein
MKDALCIAGFFLSVALHVVIVLWSSFGFFLLLARGGAALQRWIERREERRARQRLERERRLAAMRLRACTPPRGVDYWSHWTWWVNQPERCKATKTEST